MSIRLEVPVGKRYDVLVAGGGVAGVFAAICAARLGASTLLVEKDSMLGGTATMGGVDFPGLFHAWGRQIISGPCWECIERVNAADRARIPAIVSHPEHHWDMQIRVDAFSFACAMEEMCREAGVEVRLHTMLCAAQEAEDGIQAVLAKREGMEGIFARRAVDATGDAELAAMLGCPLDCPDQVQPGTLMNRIGGYDISRVRREDVDAMLSDLDLQGASPWHILENETVPMHMDSPDARTSRGRTALEMRAREQLQTIVRRLRAIPGLEGARVLWAAPSFGVRESVRILGRRRITESEYSRGASYPDGICYSFYPIDLHMPGGIDIRPLPEGVVPSIPYGALLPRDSSFLLAAGRCISGDARAASAYRVQATCMATGQAAGAAAALSARQGIPAGDLSVSALRRALASLHCVVPEE